MVIAFSIISIIVILRYYNNIIYLYYKIQTMGVTKRFIHSDYINEIASIAKVLAHPARVAILKHISEQKSCICNDLVDEIGLSQATISQHLSVIAGAGLLKGTFEGKAKCYCINLEQFEHFRMLINSFFITAKQKCC